jgi:uncharacterized protein YlxP (DUF503 family)
MTIGFCRLVLYLPESGSLKSKRSIVKGLVERIRQKFNVSVSEVDEHDLWQKAVLGVAIVTTDSGFASQVLSKVVALVEGEGRVHLLDYTVEMM